MSPDSGWHTLHLPWQTESTAPASRLSPEVRWRIEGGALVWEMRLPLPLAGPGTFRTDADGFTEGLWTQDVAEGFIAEAGTGHYTEYNLSPAGAWWACCYTAPRLRRSPQPDWERTGILAETVWTETHWLGRMICPLPPGARRVGGAGAAGRTGGSSGESEAGGEVVPARFAVNFTAVVATETMREYHSLARIGGGERPDFHRLAGWIPLG
ncbi:MAG: hypothetical protein V4726_16690 [Verrucomicrobiota bacterium]